MKIKFLITIGLLSAMILTGFYAFQIIKINEHHYQIQEYKRELVELEESLNQLENIYAESSSLIDLWPTIDSLDFEEVKEITYISIEEQVFAVNP
jgi:hypothetical protein